MMGQSDVQELMCNDESALRFIQGCQRIDIDLLQLRIYRRYAHFHPCADEVVLDESESGGKRT